MSTFRTVSSRIIRCSGEGEGLYTMGVDKHMIILEVTNIQIFLFSNMRIRTILNTNENENYSHYENTNENTNDSHYTNANTNYSHSNVWGGRGKSCVNLFYILH